MTGTSAATARRIWHRRPHPIRSPAWFTRMAATRNAHSGLMPRDAILRALEIETMDASVDRN
jgi:hypothetical protein